MLLTFAIFSTDVYADISMFKGDALTLLKMMGYSAAESGAKSVAAIDAEKISSPIENENEDTDEPVVSR